MLLASLAVGLVAGFAPSPRSRAEPRAISRFARHAVCAPRVSPRLCSADEAGKNMLWDTINTEERPRLVDAFEGRDYLTSVFLAHGVFVGGLNIVGAYGENYAVQAVGIAAVLGFLSAAWGFAELATGKCAGRRRPTPGLAPARTPQPRASIPPPQRLPTWLLTRPAPAVCRIAEDGRPGFARERSIMWYTSSYLAGVMWLSLRLSPLYPASLTPLDPALCSATIAVYLYGFASPVRTVLVTQHVDSAALLLPRPFALASEG